MSPDRRASAPVPAPRWLTAIMAVLVTGISLLAFVLSFDVLSDLATRAGIPADIAWAWPVIVDGSIVTAMLVIFAWRGQPRRATVWPWVTLLFFAAVSVIGNGVHTAVVYDATLGLLMWFAIFVGAIPPVGLLLSSEMLVRLLTPADEVVAATVATVAPLHDTVATVTAKHDSELTERVAPAVISGGNLSNNAEISGIVAAVATVTPLNDTVATVSPEHDSDMTAAVAIPDEVPANGGDVTVSHEPVAAVVTPDATPVATHDTDATPVATVPHLHAVEFIPADPAGQIDWIVARAKAGHDVTRETLLRVFEEAGQPVSDRTLQRRIANARELAPELLEANA